MSTIETLEMETISEQRSKELRRSPHIMTEKGTVALLCPSPSKFVFHLLAFSRLGRPVLLIAYVLIGSYKTDNQAKIFEH